MNMLEIRSLKKRFGEVEVLKDVNLIVPEHSVFGFVGKNGAGKTTTMKIILGLIKADEGEIYVNGQKVVYGNSLTNGYIGYLPDVPEYYDYMTPYEYLAFCGKITGMKKNVLYDRIEEMLQLVGLEKEKRRIKGFSRGMKQRLGIAQALLNKPKLLICDEPTSALDPVGRKEVLDVLTAAKQDTTVIFSTHILSDVEKICDEIAFLNDGEIILSGSMQEVRTKHRTGSDVTLELSEMNDQKLNDLKQYLLDNHIRIKEVREGEWSLESLFMEVIEK